MVNIWALKGVLYPYFGVYVCVYYNDTWTFWEVPFLVQKPKILNFGVLWTLRVLSGCPVGPCLSLPGVDLPRASESA